MIVIAPLRTARLEVRLRELSIGDEIALCHMLDGQHEKALSEFLRRAVEHAEALSERHVTDPRAWTIGERYLALAHYNLHAREDGPDYPITESTKLSDYLDRARESHEPIMFEALDDNWVFRPATGAALEALETMQIGAAITGRTFWLFGLMAMQLLRAGEEMPDPVSENADYTTWLARRIDIMRALPGSDMEKLYAPFREANEQATLFFRVWFDDEGVIVMPKEAQAATPAARFLVHSGFSELALALSGKS
ncbi:hypothetical protein PQR05_29565 [Paraburkholderia sediminicola]|uniref:hypothetical protein n=1 Tax=Paraburkholderia sediminicola TaxID=458836 RepID=UPI0038B92057